MPNTQTAAASPLPPHPVPPAAPAPRRRGWWLLGALALVAGLALAARQLLDPWLRRTLEQQVATRTQGQYRLQIGALETSIWQRAVRLRHLRLRPAGTVADTLPRIRLDVARLHLTGVGLLALLRQDLVPVDSLVLDSARLEVMARARRPTNKPSQPLHQQLPLNLKGVEIGYFGLLHAQARYLPQAATAAGFRRADLSARDLLISPAGAADTQRLAYAAAWKLHLRHGQGRLAGHRLHLAGVHLATADGRIQVDSLRIRPPGPDRGKRGSARVDLDLPRLRLTGLDAAAWQHRRHLHADSLVLNGAKLAFTPPRQAPPPVWKLLSKFVRRTDLAQLRVQGADVRIDGLRHSPNVRGLSLTGRGIRIDSLAARAPGRIAYARAWRGRAGVTTVPFDPPYYRASSQQLRFDTEARTLGFDNLALTPRYSAVGMNRRKGYQAPAIRIALAALTCDGLDFAGLVRNADFRVARVRARRPLVRIASDGRGPLNPNWSRISPEEMRKLPMIVDVRRLDIEGGNLYSSYRSPLTPTPGTISINRFNGTFRNLSNDPRRQTAATPLTGRAATYLQNRCRLDARVSMYLLDPRGRHRVWGAFGPGQFAMLNPMTVPTRLVRFRSGELRRMRFELHADRRGVTGTTWTEYTGLQLTLLSYGEKEGKIKKSMFSRLKSRAVNVVVIRDQNPRKRGELVTGAMTSTREPRFSVFTLWRQGLVSGLFHNVGVPRKIAQKLSESKDEAPLPKRLSE